MQVTSLFSSTSPIVFLSILVALSVVSWIAQLGHLKGRKGHKQTYTLIYLALNSFSAAEQANQSHWLYELVAKKSQT